jgi:hypothetical protein
MFTNLCVSLFCLRTIWYAYSEAVSQVSSAVASKATKSNVVNLSISAQCIVGWCTAVALSVGNNNSLLRTTQRFP